MNKNVLFLYTELAGYTVNCMKKSIVNYKSVSINVISWPLASEAPFEFDFGRVKHYNRNNFDYHSMISFVENQSVDLIICSGWVDKDYVKVCEYFKGKLPTVLAFDNQWIGSFKQIVAKYLSPFYIKKNFTHAWVPGGKQKTFALNLGFKEDRIKTGFYVADTTLFNAYYNRFKKEKQKQFPKRFLYVGRYVKHKGIFDLWKAFIKLQEKFPSEWELWCVGTGEEYENRLKHPKIKHFGFLQPKDFSEVIKNTGVYILPSHIEPWGVSVQEFASAGYPMLLSNQIGSSESFFKNNENGYSFCEGEPKDLLEAMKKISSLSENELFKMQLKSIELSLSVTTKKWSESLISFKL